MIDGSFDEAMQTKQATMTNVMRLFGFKDLNNLYDALSCNSLDIINVSDQQVSQLFRFYCNRDVKVPDILAHFNSMYYPAALFCMISAKRGYLLKDYMNDNLPKFIVFHCNHRGHVRQALFCNVMDYVDYVSKKYGSGNT
jgi:hypothetical protein